MTDARSLFCACASPRKARQARIRRRSIRYVAPLFL